MPNLTLFCLSRGRPYRLKHCLGSAWATAKEPDEIEVIVQLDDDDPEVFEYRRVLASLPFHCTISVGPKMTICERFDQVLAGTHTPYFHFVGDDCVYDTIGWDTTMMGMCGPYNQIGCFDGERYSYCHPLWGMRFFREVGPILPLGVQHYFIDSYLDLIADVADARVICRDVCIFHNNFNTQPKLNDYVYQKNMKGYEHDKLMFKRPHIQSMALDIGTRIGEKCKSVL